MIKSVCLLGSAAGRNAGDAALISGIMDAIDQRLDRRVLYKIPTLFPHFVNETYTQNDVQAISVMPWTGSIKLFGLPTRKAVVTSDLSLVFDAVLFDRDLFNPMFNFLSSLYFLLPAAKKAGKFVGLYNCGVGPIKTNLGARMLKRVCDNCDFITVRDEGSADVLREIQVPESRIVVTADAALNAPACSDSDVMAIFDSIKLDPTREILAININKYINTWSAQSSKKITLHEFLELMASAVGNAADKIGAPVLLVSTYHGDIELATQLRKLIKTTVPVYAIDNRQYDHYEIKGVLARVGLLFAMRLHAMVLASSAGTPIAGLAYQPKVSHYFEHLHIPSFCTDFENFTAERISDFIVSAWRQRAEIRSKIYERLPVLQQQALVAAECVAQLEQGIGADPAHLVA